MVMLSRDFILKESAHGIMYSSMKKSIALFYIRIFHVILHYFIEEDFTTIGPSVGHTLWVFQPSLHNFLQI